MLSRWNCPSRPLLNAPEFLYRPEFGRDADVLKRTKRLTDWEQASRLSYFLWDTMPDTVLFDAAEQGRLSTREGIEAEVRRMVTHPNASEAFLEFHRQWLDLNEILTVAPDAEIHPVWNPSVANSTLQEAETHIKYIFESDEPTLGRLLLDRTTRVDANLSKLYGVPTGSTELPPDRRAGLLTRAGWLAATSHAVDPSPVQRGIFVVDRLLCAPPIPPPADVDTSVVTSEVAGGTNRDRYIAHSEDPACAGCHDNFDPVGFGFEHYDAVGRFRQADNGIPVDASGAFTIGDLAGASFDGAVEMSELLAGSLTARDCVVVQWYRYAHGRSELPEDAAGLDLLQASFGDQGNLVELLVDIVVDDAFRTVTVE